MTFTSERTLVAGPVLRKRYRGVVDGPGEPHLVRSELGGSPDEDLSPRGDPVAVIAHLTDLHVIDAQSPARFEFVNRFVRDPRFRELITMQRPHEMLSTHAIAAMVRTINEVEAGPLTGAPPRIAVMTGDGVDNAQRNELTNVLALLEGGTVRPDSGAPGYDGVQRPDWPGDIHWKPDGPEDGDEFQREVGYPRHPGLLDEAVREFGSEGLRLPWLRCWGNHEQVCQGVGLVTPALAKAMTGSRKPVEMPEGIDADTAVETFTVAPERFMAGRYREIAPDPERRAIERGDLFEEPYYVHDEGKVRFITLDTVCDGGGADGTIDPDQMHWLERRLEEVHSTFRSRDGSKVRTRNSDRYVVVLSHHGYDTLANPHCERRAANLLELLQRFGNVVLWLNGHTHANQVTPRRTFWEVTTGSIVDWPCQARLVEIYRTASGLLAIGCTMLDHDGETLAGLHRELAANVPGSGFASRRPGTPADRNAILLLPASF
ncbi:MAG TPA: metallophosphoesterase [Candidatus Dormibacteraeota bacterium]|nr:metallophosphoesterase [Candidatus Dormibacteraeota bacterium]